MPIATCFIKDKKITNQQWDALAGKWAHEIGVDLKDICLTVITDYKQSGQSYDALVQLSLPTLWSKEEVKKIQLVLLKLLTDLLNAPPGKIFILTSVIQSEHVVENGEIVKW
jgi:hypothetical protein